MYLTDLHGSDVRGLVYVPVIDWDVFILKYRTFEGGSGPGNCALSVGIVGVGIAPYVITTRLFIRYFLKRTES